MSPITRAHGNLRSLPQGASIPAHMSPRSDRSHVLPADYATFKRAATNDRYFPWSFLRSRPTCLRPFPEVHSCDILFLQTGAGMDVSASAGLARQTQAQQRVLTRASWPAHVPQPLAMETFDDIQKKSTFKKTTYRGRADVEVGMRRNAEWTPTYLLERTV